MTITKYKAIDNDASIEAVQVERETAAAVWIKSWTFKGAGTGPERRHNKRSTYENYFDTWDEAKAFLLDAAEQQVVNARGRLERATGHLGNVKGMKPGESA